MLKHDTARILPLNEVLVHCRVPLGIFIILPQQFSGTHLYIRAGFQLDRHLSLGVLYMYIPPTVWGKLLYHVLHHKIVSLSFWMPRFKILTESLLLGGGKHCD